MIDNMLFYEANQHNITLTDNQVNMFNTYYEELVMKNKVMNLTAITDYEDVVRKHFIDSLMISRNVDMNAISTVCDIGTGAGFPGIPLKITYPHIHITLVDSVNKRIQFLSEIVDKLDLTDVELVHSRTEDLARDTKYREKFDLVTARAVAALNVLSEYCLPYVKTGGHFAAYKSGNIEQELKEATNAIKILGGEEEKVDVFDFYDMKRSIVLIKKVKKTSMEYPRKTGIPSKKPL